MRPTLKELSLEAYDDVSILNSVAAHLDSIDFKKVKTKYTKGEDWTALSLRGYGPDPLDILKPNVLKTSVSITTRLQWPSIKESSIMKPILDILDKLPCEYERVRFMKLEAWKNIGKHTDKIDKEIGFDDGQIVRIHVPIRTNDNVVFTLYENTKDKIGNEHRLKTGHYYYTDVTKAHAVRNESDVDRIHLVIDCYSNNALRTLIA